MRSIYISYLYFYVSSIIIRQHQSLINSLFISLMRRSKHWYSYRCFDRKTTDHYKHNIMRALVKCREIVGLKTKFRISSREVEIALTIFVVGTAGRHEKIITHSK